MVRDWSSWGDSGGGLQNGKFVSAKHFAPPPPPQDRVKLFSSPPLKGWKLVVSPFSMAKASSYCVSYPINMLCPPSFNMAKTFSAPPFCRGKTSLAAPSRFVAPPPRNSHQSLNTYNCERVGCIIIEPHGREVPEAILNDRSPHPGLPECGRSPHEGRPGRVHCK